MPTHLTCEKIEAVSRDGTPLPMVMVYDKRFYTDQSSWIICSNGSVAGKEDLAFRAERLSLTDRGFVLAFPMGRGTRYFDDDWFFSGVGERKETHINDIIDSSIFVKEQGLT